MKQRVFFALAAVLIGLCFSGEGFSQKTEANYEEVSRKVESWRLLVTSIPFRWTSREERVESGTRKGTWVSSTTIEKIPPGRSRFMSRVKNGTFKRMEVISISGNRYRKMGRGEWQSLPPHPDYPDTVREFSGPIHQGQKSESKPRFTNQAWLIKTVRLNGRNVSVYEIKSTEVTTEGEKEITKISSARYWLCDDGFLLKKITERETVGEKTFIRNTTVYEYENIKIEAPIK